MVLGFYKLALKVTREPKDASGDRHVRQPRFLLCFTQHRLGDTTGQPVFAA
jgi:hypothetical protein